MYLFRIINLMVGSSPRQSQRGFHRPEKDLTMKKLMLHALRSRLSLIPEGCHPICLNPYKNIKKIFVLSTRFLQLRSITQEIRVKKRKRKFL